MQQGKLEEATKYFYEALKINDQYANTHFALGMIAEMEADLQSAFYSTIQAIKLNKSKDVLYQNSVRQAFEISKKIIRRHPQIFDHTYKIKDLPNQSWERIKNAEKSDNKTESKHILDRVETNIPSIIRSIKIQKKVASLNFDWDNETQVLTKIDEELLKNKNVEFLETISTDDQQTMETFTSQKKIYNDAIRSYYMVFSNILAYDYFF